MYYQVLPLVLRLQYVIQSMRVTRCNQRISYYRTTTVLVLKFFFLQDLEEILQDWKSRNVLVLKSYQGIQNSDFRGGLDLESYILGKWKRKTNKYVIRRYPLRFRTY